ncbi:hypothetical protein C0995_010198 [Termitomyces sp. Mi166|nr:hypothetical protein C0995_010198 [Termitomyces sp. Mi166\
MTITLDPPPTVNHLDRRERMRLVRSNRKLEAVLGASPCYLEPASQLDVPKASRRDGRIFAHLPTSSSSSPTLDSMAEQPSRFNPLPQKSKRPPRALELSRPFLLRLRSVPVPSSDNRASQSSSHHPSIVPVSPPSPTSTIDLEKLQSSNLKARRKKMAKLTRTLGENIPPELVFPNNASSAGQLIKSRSLEDTLTPSLSSPSSAKPRPIISRPRAMSSRSRLKIQPAPSNPAPTSVVYIHLPPRQTPRAKPTIADRRRKPRPRSLSVSTGTDMLAATSAAQASSKAQPAKRRGDLVTQTVCTEVLTIQASVDVYPKPQYLTITERATKDIAESHSPLPFQSIQAVPPRAPTSGQSHTKSASTSSPSQSKAVNAPSAFHQFGKRKELGWSGEWNHEMENVVKNLRNLKAR